MARAKMLTRAAAIATIGLMLTASACSRGAGGNATAGPKSGAAAQVVTIDDSLVKAANAEGTLTLTYSSPLDTMDGMVKEFNKAYPKIKVVAVRNAGSAGAQKILNDFQAGVKGTDVVEGSDVALNKQMSDQGAIANLEPSNASDFPAGSHNARGMWAPFEITTVTAYNANKITPAQAKLLSTGWKSILDPQFKGKFSVVAPTVGSTQTPLFYVLNNPDLGKPYLQALAKQDPTIFDTTAEARDAMVSGSTPIAWMNAWDAVSLQLISTGAPIRFVDQKPSIRYPGSAYGVISNAPHPNAAKLFWAWMLSKDGGCAATQLSFSDNQCALKGVSDNRADLAKAKSSSWYVAPSQPPISVDADKQIEQNEDNANLWYKVFDYQPAS